MDIAALSTVMHQSSVRQQAGLAVLKKAMDTAQTDSEAMLQMIAQSVEPHKGAHIDIKI